MNKKELVLSWKKQDWMKAKKILEEPEKEYADVKTVFDTLKDDPRFKWSYGSTFFKTHK